MKEKIKNWSVIIPTLWKSESILNLLISLNNCPYVDEIIIIDNDYKSRKKIVQSNKIKLLAQINNIFVNPAWNLGVQEAKNNLICLCNDDLIFDTKIFDLISMKKIKNQIIGCHYHCFERNDQNREFKLINGHSIEDGWGCLLFFEKQYYVPIPEEYKIWVGDDWLVSKFKFSKSFKWEIKTKMSETSSLPNLNSLAVLDKINFREFSSKRTLERIRKLNVFNLSKQMYFKNIYYLFISIFLKE